MNRCQMNCAALAGAGGAPAQPPATIEIATGSDPAAVVVVLPLLAVDQPCVPDVSVHELPPQPTCATPRYSACAALQFAYAQASWVA
jgi:hypothetical protein